MALEKSTVDEILTGITALDVNTRLESINKAMGTFDELFKPGQDLSVLAFNVMYVESLYNLVRDELKQSFKTMIPKEAAESIAAEQKKKKETAPKKKKKVSALEDPEFLATMRAILGGGETKT